MDFWGKESPYTKGGLSPCSRVSEGGPVVQLGGSRRSKQGCEVPHNGPLFAEADKQVGNARVCNARVTACTWVSEPQEKTI